MFKRFLKNRLSEIEARNIWMEYIEKYKATTDLPNSFHKPLKFATVTRSDSTLDSFALDEFLAQLSFVSRYTPSYYLDYSITQNCEKTEVYISYGRRSQERLIFNVIILEDGTIEEVDVMDNNGTIMDNYESSSCIESFMFSIWYSSNPFIGLS